MAEADGDVNAGDDNCSVESGITTRAQIRETFESAYCSHWVYVRHLAFYSLRGAARTKERVSSSFKYFERKHSNGGTLVAETPTIATNYTFDPFARHQFYVDVNESLVRARDRPAQREPPTRAARARGGAGVGNGGRDRADCG